MPAAGAGRRIALYLFGIALTTVVTTVATMPFTIYHFNRFPLYSVAANIVAVPITGFWMMPWAIVSCVLMPLHLEALALTPMGWGIDAIAAIAHGVTSLAGRGAAGAEHAAGGLGAAGAGRAVALHLAARAGAGSASRRSRRAMPRCCSWRRRIVLISNDAKLVAVRVGDGDYMPSHAHGGAWTEDNWTQRAAATLEAAWPKSGGSADGRLQCDGANCVYRAEGRTVAHRAQARRRGDGVRHRGSRDQPDRGALQLHRAAADRQRRYLEARRSRRLADRRRHRHRKRQRLARRAALDSRPREIRRGAMWSRSVHRSVGGWDERSIFPHQADELALNLDPVGAEDARLVGLVGGFERDRIAALAHPLQRHLVIVDQRHHDGAVIGGVGALDETVSPSKIPASTMLSPATSSE